MDFTKFYQCNRIKNSATLMISNLLFVHTLFEIFGSARAFNLDTNFSTIYSGDRGSYFGWTVSSYIHEQTPWILIGAPRAETRQPGVTKGGTVFRCIAGISDSCLEVIFDTMGSRVAYNINAMQQRQSDDKSNQWFGHTISVSGQDGATIMACAPRYVYYSQNFLRREPVGTCFISNDHLRSFQEHSPCRTLNWGYHRQGHCQAGFSGTLAKNSTRAFIGAVGSWYWQGQMFVQNITSGLNLISSKESPPSFDDSYLGYTVVSGEFDGLRGEDIAVGVPRGKNLSGKVILFDRNLNIIKELSAEMASKSKGDDFDQIGAYFGYSLTVVDVDGNKMDDIVVGTPFYNDFKNTKPSSYETGRVYVFYQGPKGKFIKTSVLEGQKPRGRFGISVASLGDINLDGYQDIVVGAPYDGPKGKGAIYIYNGGRKGIEEKFSQVIMADDVNPSYPDLIVGSFNSDNVIYLRSRPIITAHIDLKLEPEILSLDDQSCSLIDGTLVPCSVLTICVKYEGIGSPPQLDLKIDTKLDMTKTYGMRSFMLSDEGNTKASEIVRLVAQTSWCKSSYIYLKRDIRDKLSPITIQVTTSLIEQNFAYQTLKPVLDSLIPSLVKKLLHILKDCGSDNICDPNLSLISVRSATQTYKVAGPNPPTSSQNTVKPKVIGYNSLGGPTDKTLTIRITVLNQLEDAFEAQAVIYAPVGLDFVNADLLSDPGNVLPIGGRISCGVREILKEDDNLFNDTMNEGGLDTKNKSLHEALHKLLKTHMLKDFTEKEDSIKMTKNFGSVVICDIGNPLTQGAKLEFDIRFYPTNMDSLLSRRTHDLNFLIFLNSTNAEDESTLSDNVKTLRIPVETTSDLVLFGASIPDQILFPRERHITPEQYVNETNVGPQVVHVYEIINKGYTTILKADLTILWPSYILKKNARLFYLMEKPVIDQRINNKDMMDKEVVCHVSNLNDINALGLKVDRSERWKAIVNSTRIVSSGSGYLLNSSDDNNMPKNKRGDNPNTNALVNLKSKRSIDGEDRPGIRHVTVNKETFVFADNLRADSDVHKYRLYPTEIVCHEKNCTIIKCSLGPFTSGESIAIRIRSRVWIDTLIKEQLEGAVVSSKGILKITQVPYTIDIESIPYKTIHVSTYLTPEIGPPDTKRIEPWVLILAVTAGISILGLIGLGLWKSGFFLRKRPPPIHKKFTDDSSEKS
ncbi:unnamed protein product [Gordionus sp. m RMFG-2023]